MDARQNALEILRFGKPGRVVSGLPACGNADIAYYPSHVRPRRPPPLRRPRPF
jgi:hypothetical protein